MTEKSDPRMKSGSLSPASRNDRGLLRMPVSPSPERKDSRKRRRCPDPIAYCSSGEEMPGTASVGIDIGVWVW